MVPLTLLLAFVQACESNSLRPDPIANDPKLYWDLDLSHHAVTLSAVAGAPYDTLTVVATPRNYRGEPLDGLPAPQYTSRDLEQVAVTTEGLLVAVAARSQPVWVVATLMTENLKHEDSVLVQVVDSAVPPVLATFSVRPVAPDSAKVGAQQPAVFAVPDTLHVRAADPGGTPFTAFPVYFRSSDPTIATIHPVHGIVSGLQPGTLIFYASTTVFGITKTDTVPYRIGWPVVATVPVAGLNSGVTPGTFLRPEVKVGVGAIVSWVIQDGTLLEVDGAFAGSDLSNVVPGNDALGNPILALPWFVLCSGLFVPADCATPGNFVVNPGSQPMAAVRLFTTPGTYEYQSTLYGTRGRILVIDE